MDDLAPALEDVDGMDVDGQADTIMVG